MTRSAHVTTISFTCVHSVHYKAPPENNIRDCGFVAWLDVIVNVVKCPLGSK